LVGKSQNNEILRSIRCKWEYNTKIVLREIGLEFVDWINVARDKELLLAFVKAVMKQGHSEEGANGAVYHRPHIRTSPTDLFYA
jgi:hypothetical protein